MGELEDQIARLAQHRADQVPPYQAPASLSSARRRHRAAGFVAAAAVVTAIAVVAGALLWDRGDDPSVRTGPSPATELPAPSTVPPTTPPTTTLPIATCPEVGGANTSVKSGAGFRTGDPESAVLAGVTIQTSGCLDEVTFTFGGGIPDWSVEYRTSPLTLEPSGQPVDMEGSAFLVVRFEHGQGTPSDNGPPHSILAGPLSHVTEIRQTQDFEGVVTWVIGLDAELPFTATDHDELQGGRALAIAFPEIGATRAVTCSRPQDHLEFAVPPGWKVALNDNLRCAVLTLEPAAEGAMVVGTNPSTSVAGLFEASPTTTTMTTADGRTASCLEGVYAGSSPFPAGQPGFVCSVAWGNGQYLTVTTNGYAGSRYAEYKAGVQAIIASARYLP